jgi:hypothetical protein
VSVVAPRPERIDAYVARHQAVWADLVVNNAGTNNVAYGAAKADQACVSWRAEAAAWFMFG